MAGEEKLLQGGNLIIEEANNVDGDAFSEFEISPAAQNRESVLANTMRVSRQSVNIVE